MQKVINAIASDVEVIVRAITEKGDAGSRTSVKELRGKCRKEDIVVEVSAQGGNRAVIEVLYDSLLEWDRMPRTGRWPALSDIREWALSKSLPADNATLNLIRRAIWWNGHAGRSIEEAVEREIEKQMDGKWADMIAEAVARELEKVFG